VFPVRYELDFYILLRRNSVFKGLIKYINNFTINTTFSPSRFFKQPIPQKLEIHSNNTTTITTTTTAAAAAAVNNLKIFQVFE
jgi:hypothetical protein